MPRRTKRASAAIAESRIKEAVLEFNHEDIDTTAKLPSTSHLYAMEAPPVPEEVVYGNHPDAAIEDYKNGFNDDYGYRSSRPPRPSAKKLRKSDSRDDQAAFPVFDEGLPPSGRRSEISSMASTGDNSLQTLLGTSGSSSLFSSSLFSTVTTSDIPSTIKARLSHQRRRTFRQVNSTGPMILSHQTYIRMSPESEASPRYSPIAASRLCFTPVAHLVDHTARRMEADMEIRRRRE
jgi:hypothetical protein